MKVLKTSITATASLHYQQASMTIEVEDATVDDLKNIEGVTISEAVNSVKTLCEAVGANPAPDEQPRATVKYGNDSTPSANNYRPDKGYPASPAQIKYLQDKGYNGPVDGLTKKQASQILENMGFGKNKGAQY